MFFSIIPNVKQNRDLAIDRKSNSLNDVFFEKLETFLMNAYHTFERRNFILSLKRAQIYSFKDIIQSY